MRALRRCPGSVCGRVKKPRQPVHLRKACRWQRLAAREPGLTLHARDGLSCRLRRVIAVCAVEPLRRRKHRRKACPARLVCKQPGECAHAALHRARSQRAPRIGRRTLRRAHGSVEQGVQSLTQRRAYWHDRDAQRLRQPRRVHRTAAGTQRIHHVQRQHDWHAQLQQLQRQIQAARRARCVRDADDRVRLAAEQIRARDALLVREGAQCIHARQVHERHVRPRGGTARCA